jgi:hypothetical protein
MGEEEEWLIWHEGLNEVMEEFQRAFDHLNHKTIWTNKKNFQNFDLLLWFEFLFQLKVMKLRWRKKNLCFGKKFEHFWDQHLSKASTKSNSEQRTIKFTSQKLQECDASERMYQSK